MLIIRNRKNADSLTIYAPCSFHIDFNGVNGVKFGVVDELEELNIMLDFIRQNAVGLKSEDLHNILYLVRKANDYIFKIYTENTDWELLDSGDSNSGDSK